VKTQIPKTGERMEREIPIELSRVDKEANNCRVSFSSSEPYNRYFGPEILDHSESAVDLSRLNTIGTVLFNHDADKVAGRIDKAWIENERGEAEISFSPNECGKEVAGLVDFGALKSTSVGYRVQNWEEVAAGSTAIVGGREIKGPAYIARRWQPLEISIVSVPADASVGVGRSDEDPGENSGEDQGEDPAQMNQKTEGEKHMEKTAEQIALEAEQAELKRQLARSQEDLEIVQLCKKYGVESDPFMQDEKRSVEKVKETILEKLYTEKKATETTSTQIKADEVDKIHAAAIDGLALRAGVKFADKPAEGANAFRNYTMMDVVKECLERSGVSVRGKSAFELSGMALQRDIFQGVNLPYILSNVANKALMTAYQAVPTTYQQWVGYGTANDFKTMTKVQLSEAPDLDLIPASGEYKSAQLTEIRETYAIATYGKKFSLTRQDMINDDLGALTRMPGLFGNAARRKINSLVYSILTSNASMIADNVALFATGHGNYVATATANALSVTSLGTARAAMRVQKGPGGKETLNLAPSYLIVPAALETTAEQLIGSIVDPTKSNATMNPFSNRLQIVCEPLLDASSASAWYLAASAGIIDTVEVSFLNGNDAPYLESRMGFDVDGFEYKVRIDAGCKALDYRGLYKAVIS
jgi:phage head maturation protease